MHLGNGVSFNDLYVYISHLEKHSCITELTAWYQVQFTVRTHKTHLFGLGT